MIIFKVLLKLMSHFQKWPIVDGFRGKNGIILATVCSSEANVLEDIDFSFIGQLILCLHDQDMIFNASVADFVSWNSRLIVRLAILDHRPTIGRQFVMVVYSRQTFRHLAANRKSFCIQLLRVIEHNGLSLFIENDH